MVPGGIFTKTDKYNLVIIFKVGSHNDLKSTSRANIIVVIRHPNTNIDQKKLYRLPFLKSNLVILLNFRKNFFQKQKHLTFIETSWAALSLNFPLY